MRASIESADSAGLLFVARRYYRSEDHDVRRNYFYLSRDTLALTCGRLRLVFYFIALRRYRGRPK